MKTIRILYTCNIWHERSSYSIVGVFTTTKRAIAYAKEHAKITGSQLKFADIHDLQILNQTHGRDENYLIDKFPLNP